MWRSEVKTLHWCRAGAILVIKLGNQIWQYSHLAILSFYFWDSLMWACNVVIVEDDPNYYLLIYWFPPGTFVHALWKKNSFTVVWWWYTPLFSALEAEAVGFEAKHGLQSEFQQQPGIQKSPVLKNRNKTHLHGLGSQPLWWWVFLLMLS